jgi:hypothetical protein
MKTTIRRPSSWPLHLEATVVHIDASGYLVLDGPTGHFLTLGPGHWSGLELIPDTTGENS